MLPSKRKNPFWDRIPKDGSQTCHLSVATQWFPLKFGIHFKCNLTLITQNVEVLPSDIEEKVNKCKSLDIIAQTWVKAGFLQNVACPLPLLEHLFRKKCGSDPLRNCRESKNKINFVQNCPKIGLRPDISWQHLSGSFQILCTFLFSSSLNA